MQDNQQRKALLLSLLMFMLAQTAYIESYRGWTTPQLEETLTEPARVSSPAVCASTSRSSGDSIYVDVVEGSNDYPGTNSCPLSSLEQAITIAGSESASNPEIILHAGLYHENVSINNIDNLLIRAADGERVVFDGTRSITDDLGGVWGSTDSDGIQEVTLSQDGWQLFLAHEEQVPARWPNARFDDETVFNRSYWAEGILTGSNNAYTKGWLTDAGPEAGVHTGLNETVNASGLDPVGAIAVMNLGSFRSNSRVITDWNPNNGTFAYDGDGVGWKTKHHAYFLEGKRELIDVDGEWWFNNTDNRLHYKTPSGQDANNLNLRVKVQPFAISVDGSDGVTIQGIDFFGTTVNFNNCDGCSLTNATLEYPSTSKRGLGIAGESEDDRWMTRFYRSKNSFVDNISITNTDGGAIEFQGSPGQSHNNTVNNSYFHAIDWSAADQKGLMVTIYEGGRDMYFTNNSVHLTGASSVLSIGDAPKVFYNEVWDVGHLQTDGAVVQVMQAEAPGAEIAYNWIHDIIKYGARFDAPINEVGEGMNGTMHHNVIWNAAGGLMVKGDYHDIHNNTVFNSTGKNDIIFLTDGGINNKNSTLHYNAVDAMADHRSDDIFANPIPYGADWMNWNGYIQGKQDGVTTLNGEINSGGWVQTGYTCIINSTKSLLCWGYNANGQLGLGNTTHQSSPVAVAFPNAGTVEKVAESGGMPQHNCAIMDNGSLYCWGKNSNGELGIGSTTQQTTPQLVNLGSGVKAVDVSVGDGFTCAVTDAGALMCWGTNGAGRLGIGNTTSAVYSTPQTANLPTNRKAVDVQLGRHFGYALLDNGDVVSWGYNHVGYLGTGNTTTMHSPTVISLDSQRQVVSMSGGKHHGCIGYDNGSVVCTGRDNVGQQGTNSPSDVNDLTFSYTNALANLSIIAFAGKYTSCALLANGTAQCWGGGAVGQMGDGTTGNNHYPDDLVNTPSGRFIVDMSMSGEHACIVLDDGSVACWGRNNAGQLGLGNTTNQYQPVVLTGLDDLLTRSVHEMLVDPANNDFRPKWGSHLHILNAGAYAADDADPWTAGISWTYTTPNPPVAGCMLDYADNYDADATLSDGSCLFASYSPPSTLDLRLHLDPTNSSSYSGSGTDLVDLSTYGNDGTIDGAEWEANRTRFYYDGSCSGATAPANQAGTYDCDEVTFAETNDHDPDANGDWSVSVWINATTVQHSVIIGKWNGGGSASDLGYIIRIGSDNKLYTSVGTTSGSSAVSTSRISIDEDRWYHLVMVADVGNMLRLYADGVNVVNASLSGSGSVRNTTSGISIGSYNAGEYNQPFDGNIGEVMIFADALNSTTINQMYNASKGTYSNTTRLSYSDSSYTFVKGQAYNLPLSVSNGDLTTSYTLIGSLPSGMSFGSDNGTIWGTPTTDMSSTNYIVTANNSAGSFSTTFTMQIMSAPSGVSYSPSSMTLEKGTAMTTNTPTYSGSTVTSWSVSPALPSGLNFDTSTGAISGTPSVLQISSQSYTVTATNGQGSATTSVSITINDQVPVISYTSPVEISNNREMTTATPTNSGGAVTSWEISPSLPTGLSFGSTNGSIWGTPENVTSNATYTIYANNSGGSASATLTLNMNWTLTPSVDGAYITRNSSIGTDITWEWDYDPLETGNLTMYATWRNTCAIRDDGDVYCWGRNGNGQLGIGSMGNNHWKDRPTKTNNLGSDAVSVSMGEQHTCAVLDTGVLKCWGRNNHGQVGVGSGGDKDSPQTVNVGSGRTTTSVYLGYHHTCAILDDQSVKCWGRNQDGELGVGSTTSSFNTPQSIASLGTNRHAISLALGQGFTCALLDDGSIKCWGQDDFGQRGDGGGYGSAIRSPPSSAISLPTGRTATQISAGEFHVCALLDDASVVCWGKNTEGQLGDGTTSHRTSPVTTSSFGSGHTVSYVSAGYDHVCALLTDGGVRCWGSNNNGQLGDGTTTDRSSPPSTDVNLGSGYTAIGISSGGGHTCAMLNDGDMKCWGARGSGQLGDDSNFASSDQTTPVFVHGTRVWQEGDFLTSLDVSGATCGISPALPTGMSLTSGTCAISGTPTVTALNATYTVWANISGQSFSGQVWLEVGLNAPIPSYSPNSYIYTKGTAITPIVATNTGGEVTTWELDTTLPSGLNFGSSNGTIWGTPDTITSTTTYTIWANNSAGSASTTITFTVNDIAPSISYSLSSLSLLKGAQMSALVVTNSGGTIVSCSVSPSLPNGMSLSSTCELSGTPTVAATNTSYTITATNTGGSGSTSIYIEVLNSGGTLTVTPTHSTGSVNATLASIASSYTHSLTIPSWTSGVTNTSVKINDSGSVAGTAIAAWDNGNLVIAWTRPIYGSTTQHVLAISVYDGSSWTTQNIDTASRTGYRPSIAIDNQGALHIAYLDRDNTNLRYATNASGTWVLSTLDNSAVNPNNAAAKTGIAIDSKGHVHIIHPVQGSGVWVLNHTTNVSGSFVSTTITDTTKDDGKYASLGMAGNGSLHISVYRDSGGSDLRYYTDESGVWTNETVRTGSNFGKDSVIALNSKDEVVIVYRRDDNNDDIYISVGNRGSWTSSQVASNRNAMYLAVAIDSNDDVHISSHNSGGSSKDLEYFTNSSGSWVRKTLDSGVGGMFGSIVVDNNDDIHIAHADAIGANDLQYATAKGSGKGLAVNPVFSVSPALPDGLILNWKTGEITGTPTVASANTTYTLTAVALGATTTATFTLHVTGVPGDISYNDILGTNGVAITPVAPTISTNSTTGSISSWAINATLPTGLTFETSNGTIWGTPTQVISGAVYTIWANNSAGSKSTTINITIDDLSVSSITYAPENITLSYYHTMTTSTPTTTGGSATSWAISPSLPSGLTFNTATGAISGTPETLQTTTVTYTIWANNSGGSFSDQINITINDHSPALINYFGDNITLDYNQTITPIDRLEVKPDIIAAGEDHTCAIQSDGSVRCWGEGSFGRLGHGGTGDKNTPTATSSLGAGRTAIDITAGSTHTCAVLDNGSVVCWGANNYGQLGDGTTTNRMTPTQTISLGRPAVAVEAGSHFSTCALLDNGSVSCWGRNHKGQLGRGFTNSTVDLSQRTPALTLSMPGGQPVVALDISHYMVCGVLGNGGIACWGQYGGGNTPTLQTFFNSSNPAIDVSTGRYAGCGLLENGSVTCWGTGWLGTGGESQSANPGVIWPNLGSGRTAVQIEMGRKHRCVLLDDDSVKCWGDDSYGQLGNGAGQGSKNAPFSTTFSSNLGLQNMISGHWHTCIASKTNEIYCWGDGASGKQGDGSTNLNGVPGKTSHFSGTNPVMAYGDITSWAIHPSPPSGLTFDSTNGTLYGTPTAPLGQTNFTIYANNSGGSTSTILVITINDEAPGQFQYDPENNTLTNNTATIIAPTFTNPGGNVTSWVINASLPNGVSFGTNNGTIYGTPTELWTQTSYMVWANNSGGSIVAYLNITVVDELPAIAYSPTELILTNNTVSSDLPLIPSITGPGQITSWEINATLPAGLNFGTSNGTIWGTPTALQTSVVNYTIWANNTGGSSSATISIIVNDQLPTISYNPENLSLVNNTVSGDLPLNVNSNGPGIILSWEIYPSLPSGLSFGINNGTIWGTPTELRTNTVMYTVFANNSGGSSQATVNITIVDQLPSISYSPENYTLVNNTISSDLPVLVTLNGPGEITSWEIYPALPSGLNFGVANGTIWGIPTSLQTTPVTYTIWANNSGGSSQATVNITIIDQLPTLSYNPENFTLTNNTASPDLPALAILTGPGDIVSWEISPALPAGLTFGVTNGSIWGIPTILQTSPVTYKIWANNSGGSTNATINITINDQLPTLSYSPSTLILTNNTVSSDLPLDPTLSGSGLILSWEISETLPAGLAFGTSNGTIWGTPTTLQTSSVTYTIWANNSGGSSSATVTITINDQLPTLSYSPQNLTLTNNTSSPDLPLNANLNGPGIIVSWAIHPSLPSGLSFGANNGTIWGVPTTLQISPVTYTVFANNSGGSSQATVNITIIDQLPSLSYSPQNFTLVNNTANSNLPISSTLNGPGEITSWEISPALPAGLTFGTTNGSIWGTPTSLQTTPVTYTIWANNSGGSNNATINITIIELDPLISYSPNDLTLTKNTNSPHLPLLPSNSGGPIPSYVISTNNTNDGQHYSSFDSNGSQHVLFKSGNGWGYSTNQNGSWEVNTNFISGVSSTYGSTVCGFAIDSDDNMHIVNARRTGSSTTYLEYMTNQNGSWESTTLQTNLNSFVANNAELCSFTYGDDGSIHIITLSNSSSRYINYLSNQSGSWEYTTFSGYTSDIKKMRMVLNSDNDAVVSWTHTPGRVYVGTLVNGEYSLDYSDSGTGVGGFVDIFVDSSDVVHMVNSKYAGSNGFAYITNQSGSWVRTDLPLPPSTSYHTSNAAIAVDDSGKVHIIGHRIGALYFTNQIMDLTYTTYDGSSWSTTILSNNSYESWISLGFDRDGKLAITTDTHALGQSSGYTGELVTIAVNGSTAYGYSITPNLPDGLFFNPVSGAISGKSTVLMSKTMFTIIGTNSGGSSTTYLNITVVDLLPNFTYSPQNITLTNNTGSADLPLIPTNQGPNSGDVDTWEIEGTLPAGLNFGPTNGTIWGIATELWTTTTYTIWGNNTGGSLSVNINITVIDAVPIVSYSPSNLVIYNNTASINLPFAPIISGQGEIVNWELNSSLPSGLSFGNNNGTVYGIATQLWNQTAYKVWANNTGGSIQVYFNITVVDNVPSISYNPQNITLYKNTIPTNLPLAPIISGQGEIITWEISPTLPSGLNFGGDNGTIWGMPTQLQLSPVLYTIYGNNSGGTATAMVNITILHAEPMFTYTSYNLTLVNNTLMTSLSPTSTGGIITTWEVSPSLPVGISFDSSTGSITGTPTVVQSIVNYTIWGNNTGGSHSIFMNITIYDPAVTLEYNPENFTLTRTQPMVNQNPIFTGIVDNWTILPALPSGLIFTDGVISGTPTVNMTTTMYTIWANNTGGPSSHTINITILEPIVVLDYSPENLTLTRNQSMSTLNPILSGGYPLSWEIHPALPNGLVMTNGVISGTPTVNMTTTMYTIWANNSGGSTNHTINITILEPPIQLTYNPSNLTLTRDIAMNPLIPNFSGGAVENWSITPSLAQGLTFTNGEISGTPSVNMTTTMYTIWANNSGGNTSTTINITILEPIVDLSYNPENITLIRNQSMSQLYPIVAGGNPSSWGIYPTLPAGLVFDNGVIYGTPQVNMTVTLFTIFANTTGGTATANINITILEPVVEFVMQPSEIVLTRNQSMMPISAIISGGAVATWGVSPDLPAGLTFIDGTLSGTPEVNLTRTQFALYANNTGGSAIALINITILEPAPQIAINPANISLMRGVTMDSISAEVIGDAMPENWSIWYELPEGLEFENGTISGTPLVNMTRSPFLIWANNSGGSTSIQFEIEILEPPTIFSFNPENYTLTKGEDNASIIPSLAGGNAEIWTISPALPDGMVFENGSIFGIAINESLNVTYTITATNSGGSNSAQINISVVEPVPILSVDTTLVLTRYSDLANTTINNTGGIVATWEIYPALPQGITLVDGLISGIALENMSATTFTIWANNSGGSASIDFTLEVLEPAPIIRYLHDKVELVQGISKTSLIPISTGGEPESWAIEPELPPGLIFINGLIFGTPTEEFNLTTFTVWANNSQGSSSSSFQLESNYPVYYARYEVTRFILETNQTIETIVPLYYFGEDRQPVWSIEPELPQGLTFDNGVISGTTLAPSNLTTYNVLVTGEMAPVELFIIIEVRGEIVETNQTGNNQTEVDPDTPAEPELSFIIPLLFLIILFVAALIAANIYIAAKSDDDDDEEEDGSENQDKD